jgi:hypothetical protein
MFSKEETLNLVVSIIISSTFVSYSGGSTANETEKAVPNSKEPITGYGIGNDIGVYVVTDPETGCQYLYTVHTVFPRYDNTGKQICLDEDWK